MFPLLDWKWTGSSTLSSRIGHAWTEIVTFFYIGLHWATLGRIELYCGTLGHIVLYCVTLSWIEPHWIGAAWKGFFLQECNCVQLTFSATFANHILLHSTRLPQTVLILLFGTFFTIRCHFLPFYFTTQCIHTSVEFTWNIWTLLSNL